MKLTSEQIEHLADLARIRLGDVEKVKYQNQLSSILEYVNKLQAVDTADVETTAQVTGLVNVSREDRVEGCDAATRDLIIKNFPARQDDLLAVKGVFGAATEEF